MCKSTAFLRNVQIFKGKNDFFMENMRAHLRIPKKSSKFAALFIGLTKYTEYDFRQIGER